MKDRLLTVCISVAATMGLLEARPEPAKELDVDRLIVRKELIVSDTGEPWEKGFEEHNVARGLYARSLYDGPGGLWVRSRLIKTELDDPFDDRFHAMNRDGSMFRAPGHISWNVFLDGHWRQLAIIQGETLENSEVPLDQWSGGNHPGRLRIQSFRPSHPEPLTDAIIGQGKLSVGGGGLPYPESGIDLWGGAVEVHNIATPERPEILSDDGTGTHEYAIVAVGIRGERTAPSPALKAKGRAKLRWGSVSGGDAYVILRDGKPITEPIRIEGSAKEWEDK